MLKVKQAHVTEDTTFQVELGQPLANTPGDPSDRCDE